MRSISARRVGLITLVLVLIGLFAVPVAVNAQAVAAATTSGFGAAFGYAQTIGNTSYTQAGSIGNGAAFGYANTSKSNALSATHSSGSAAAMSTAIGTPFGSTAEVIMSSIHGGSASAFAAAAGHSSVHVIPAWPWP